MRRPGIAVVGVALLTSGCTIGTLNDHPLPLAAGTGDSAYQIVVQVQNAANLVPNSEVKLDDVTVGSVRRITFDGWHADLTLGIEGTTRVPVGTRAQIAQKSLLGAEYVKLEPPAKAAPALGPGSTIGLASSGNYPETEDVLSALGSLLNGGGLGQLAVITRELNAALGGREEHYRSVVRRLGDLVGVVDRQRKEVVASLAQANRLGGTFAHRSRTLAGALREIPPALNALARQRPKLVQALAAMANFGRAGTKVVVATRADLVADLTSLQPLLRQLANSGKNLTGVLGGLTYPFPVTSVTRTFRGDYINFFPTIDLTLPTLERDWLRGNSLDGLFAALAGGLPATPSKQATNPLTAPLAPHPGGGVTGPVTGLAGTLVGQTTSSLGGLLGIGGKK